MRSRSRPGLRRSRAIWECPDLRPSGPVFSGKSQTWTRTAGFGLVQTGSQSVRDRTSPTLGSSLKDSLENTSRKLRYGFGSISSSLAVGVSSLAASVSCIEIMVITCILSQVSYVILTGCTKMLSSRWLPSLSGCPQQSGQHVNLTLPVCQLMSGLCSASQVCPKTITLWPMLKT